MDGVDLWKVFASLGVPGVALGIFYMLYKKLDFGIPKVRQVWVGPILILFLLLTAGVVFYALTLWAPNPTQEKSALRDESQMKGGFLIEDARGVKATIPEFKTQEISMEVTNESSKCSEYFITGIQPINQTLCEKADYLMCGNFLFHDQLLDVTVLNTSHNTVILNQLSLDILEAYQIHSPPGADYAEPVDVTTEVEIEHKGALPVRVMVPCEEETDIVFYQSFKFDNFTISKDGKCYFDAVIDKGQIFVAEQNFSNCEAVGATSFSGSDCRNVYISDFQVKTPFSFSGIFPNPIRVPPNTPMRFLIKIKNFGNFPNNMFGKLSLDNGTFELATIYFVTLDSSKTNLLMSDKKTF